MGEYFFGDPIKGDSVKITEVELRSKSLETSGKTMTKNPTLKSTKSLKNLPPAENPFKVEGDKENDILDLLEEQINMESELHIEAPPRRSPSALSADIDDLLPSVLEPKSLIMNDKIGEGTYGEVMMCVSRLDSRIEAATKRNIIEEKTNFLGSLKEFDVLTKLRGHPFIVDLMAVSFVDPFVTPLEPLNKPGFRQDDLFFVFEKAAYDGHSMIYDGQTSPGYLKLAMLQILIALEFMHSKNIIHRDIKPSNLLWYRYGGERAIKICDFGLAKINTSLEPSTPRTVTSWYRSPEISFKLDYNIKSDIWSAGCVFYEMVSNRALLKGIPDSGKELLTSIMSTIPNAPTREEVKVMNRKSRYGFPSTIYGPRASLVSLIGLTPRKIKWFDAEGGGTYKQYIDLIEKMIRLNPSDRFSATEALNHPFFSSYVDYIKLFRSKHPPFPDPVHTIKITECVERKWIAQTAFVVFNSRRSLSWYKHRTLFQAIDLFDRYIEYLNDSGYKDRDYFDNLSISQTQGVYHTRFDTDLRFMVCIYMSIKYFSSMGVSCSYETLCTEEFRKKDAIETARIFELLMVRKVLKMRIYRDTVYESITKFEIIPTELIVKNLVVFYGNMKSFNGTTEDIFQKCNPKAKKKSSRYAPLSFMSSIEDDNLADHGKTIGISTNIRTVGSPRATMERIERARKPDGVKLIPTSMGMKRTHDSKGNRISTGRKGMSTGRPIPSTIIRPGTYLTLKRKKTVEDKEDEDTTPIEIAE